MNDHNKKEDTVKLSCYLDRKSFEEAKIRAQNIGLSISAYIRFLIKKDLNN